MNSNSFSLPQEHHEAEQTTKVDILRTGHKKNCFLITIYQFSMLKVSPLRMVQTGETVPPDKHVRIKFHQTGPSRVVKLTPTARDTDCFFSACCGKHFAYTAGFVAHENPMQAGLCKARGYSLLAQLIFFPLHVHFQH